MSLAIAMCASAAARTLFASTCVNLDVVGQQAGLVDEAHLALSPTLLGQGEALLAGIDLTALGFKCTEHVTSRHAMHVVLSQ